LQRLLTLRLPPATLRGCGGAKKVDEERVELVQDCGGGLQQASANVGHRDLADGGLLVSAEFGKRSYNTSCNDFSRSGYRQRHCEADSPRERHFASQWRVCDVRRKDRGASCEKERNLQSGITIRSSVLIGLLPYCSRNRSGASSGGRSFPVRESLFLHLDGLHRGPLDLATSLAIKVGIEPRFYGL
jgi:hypothetical protein